MPGTQQIPVFPPFAVEANYPAGANDWNGTPTKVLPVPDYMLPDTKPPAQWFNYIFNAASAGTWFANGASQTVSGLNWGALVPLSTFNHSTANATMAACWHPQGAVWWVANVQNSNALDLWNRPAAIDAAWVNPSVNTMLVTVQKNAAPNQAFVALAPDPSGSGTVWLGIVENATACHVWTFNGAAYSAQTTVSVGTGQATVVMHTFAGKVIIGVGSQAADDAKLFVQPNNTTVLSGAGVTAAIWRFADNGTICLAMAAFTANPPHFWFSYDGVAWTNYYFSNFLAPGEQIFGLVATQDANGPCFLLGINTPGGHPRFMVSHTTAPVEWVAQSQTYTMGPGVDMRANDGSCVVVTTTDGNTTGFSVDGGATWYPAYEAALAANNATSTWYEPPLIEGNGVGFLMLNSTSVRLSLLAGLPQASM